MMAKNKGFVLITVLIFLQTVLIMTLFMLQTSWIITRQVKNNWNKELTTHYANLELEKIEQQIKQMQPICIIPITPSKKLYNQSINWWQTVGCTSSLQTLKYYYVVEILGIDPCAFIQSKQFIANYLRVSLIGKMNQASIFLQSTVIVPKEKTVEICLKEPRIVSAGRQMLREY